MVPCGGIGWNVGWLKGLRPPVPHGSTACTQHICVRIVYSGYAATGVTATERSPDAIVKLPPTATVLDVARSSEPRNVPDVLASKKLTCEYVSADGTLVQFRSALVLINPPDAAENVACWRVVFAATFDVPAAPAARTRRAQWNFSPRASISTSCLIRRARVSGRLASWIR